MQRHEKVADRAGSLVTERVRSLIEAANVRAERTRRDAAGAAQRLDTQRIEAASRIVSQVEELEGVLERLRGEMRSGSAEGSYVEEPRMIEAAKEIEEAPPADEVVVEPAEEDEASPPAVEEEPETEDEVPEPSDQQPTRFSFLRRRGQQDEEGSEGSVQDAPQASATEEDSATTYSCTVCGRGFAGDEAELKSLGWVIADSGEVTCADCHSAGWLKPSG
jgi:hypothetical protein